jgi:HK97 family phage portal protein
MSEERVLSDFVWTPERGENDPEVRSISWNNLLLSDEVYSGKFLTAAEIRINPDTALQSTTFLACCRIISETVSSLPIHVYRRLKNGHEEIASEIPLYHVLTFAPNSWQTKFEFFEQMVMALTCWGNSYTEVNSGKYGAVTELNNLHPSRMRVERLENGRLKYSYNDPQTGRLLQYTQDQIMHVRWTPEPDGVKGMVPVEVSRDAIALSRACEIYASKFWANMGRPGIVLQTDGALSAETAERLRDNWERIHRGVQNAYKTAVLTNGLKVESFGATNNDSQFLEVRRFQIEEICRVFRLPLHLVQGQGGGSLEIQGQEFINYTLMPWLTRIEQSISRSLIYDDAVYYAKFDTRGLLRGDSNSRAAFYSTMLNLGIFSINECRKAEGLGPLGPEADKHLVAMNLQPLEEAVKPKPDPSMMPGFGSGAPPQAPGGPPSLSEVKTGKPPIASPKGEDSAKRSLNPQDAELEEAHVEIAEEEGKWSKESAHYIEKNPFAARGIKCHNCTHYVEEGGCKIVSGLIGGEAICKLWVIPQEKITQEPESRAFCPTGPGGGVKNDCGSKDDGGPAAESGGKKTNKGNFPIANSLPKEVPAGHESLSEYVAFKPVPEGSGNSAFAVPPSDEDLAQALIGSNKSKGTKIGKAKELPEGTTVALRIDIPAFNHSTDRMGKSVYAITVHEDKGGKSKDFGSPIGYEPMARLSGPVRFDSKETEAVRVATGETTKTPLATVKGKYTQDRTIPADIDTWTPVGFDPKKAAYFYDKKTGDEILSGTDAVSVGNTVFTRNPQRGPRNAKTHYRSLEEMMAVDSWGLESRGFCPTGEGGGIDNSCGDDEGGGDSPAAPKGDGDCPKPCGEVDVHADKNDDGVTDTARVGVPAFDVPPPPGIPRMPNLDEKSRAAEEAFVKHFENDPEGVSSQFRDLVMKQGDPPTFGTDDAKCLTDVWSESDPEKRAENRATLNTALHQCANAVAKRAFVQHLDTLEKGDSIMVTVGGCGAGKGFALKNNPDALELKGQAKAIWDSAGDQNATENPWIQAEAEKRGLSVTYVFVHADPKVQWADPNRGVVKRASDPKDGRMVDAKVFADSYAIGAKNHHAFHQANKDNSNARFVFLDNTGKPKSIPGVPKEALDLNPSELASFAEKEVEKAQAPERVKKGALAGRRIWKK